MANNAKIHYLCTTSEGEWGVRRDHFKLNGQTVPTERVPQVIQDLAKPLIERWRRAKEISERSACFGGCGGGYHLSDFIGFEPGCNGVD